MKVRIIKNYARRIAERLSRGRVIKRSFFIKGEKVFLYVSPDSQLKYLKFGKVAFDSDLISIASNLLRPNWNVYDVGANVGVFTLAASRIVGTGSVVSIEADDWLASWLRRSQQLKSNQNFDIRVISVALSNEDSVAEFDVSSRGRARNSLSSVGGNCEFGSARYTHFVPTLKLDTIVQRCPPPNFVKIDVEGAEALVLAGSSRVISEIRPVFYIEVNQKTYSEVNDLLNLNEYVTIRTNIGNQDKRSLTNLFFVPNEKPDLVKSIKQFVSESCPTS